jgi:protocatechuate 3,4-dioxygenase beta subunit
MTPPPFIPSYLPETPSQTAGPYVHIGLIPEQAGFEIFENNLAAISPVRMSRANASSSRDESSMARAT